MININYVIRLDVGVLHNINDMEAYDSYDLVTDESVLDILASHEGDCDAAELYVLDNNTGACVSSIAFFKKIKLKGKGYRWVIS